MHTGSRSRHLAEAAGDRPDTRPVETGRTGPAVARLTLGARLRRLREAQFVTREQAGHALRTTPAAISLLESGRVRCGPRDVADLLTIYQVADETEWSALLDLVDAAAARGWWAAYEDVLPEWLETCIGLEDVARTVRSHDTRYVPALLQTADYAGAALAVDHPYAGPERLHRKVELRLRRQQVLHGAHAPRLWAVIDEAALRRPLGSPATRRAQLRHLMALCGHPRITLQVRLSSAENPPEADGSVVSLFRLPYPGLPDVLCLERPPGACFPDSREDVEYYRRRTDYLVMTAEPATETLRLLHRVLQQA